MAQIHIWILGSYYVLGCDFTFLGQKHGIINEELVRTEQSLISTSIKFLSKNRFPGGMGEAKLLWVLWLKFTFYHRKT